MRMVNWRWLAATALSISLSGCGTMYATVKDRQGRDVMLLGHDPSEWEIVAGRLFIFGDLSGRETWKLDREFYIKKADEYWPEIERKGWRWQSFKAIYLQHVPHYQTGWNQIAKWQAKHGKPFAKEKHGNVLLHLIRVPGWRAAVGYGIPAVGWPDDR